MLFFAKIHFLKCKSKVMVAEIVLKNRSDIASVFVTFICVKEICVYFFFSFFIFFRLFLFHLDVLIDLKSLIKDEWVPEYYCVKVSLYYFEGLK